MGKNTNNVTWIELFFDLGYVALIAQLAYNISPTDGILDLMKFILVFVAVFFIWWMTTANRNLDDNEDSKIIFLIQIQMFFIMTISILLHSVESLGIEYILTGIFAARLTILWLIYLHKTSTNNRIAARSRWVLLIGYSLSTFWYLLITLAPTPLMYFFFVLLIIYDFLLPSIQQKWHKNPLYRLDKNLVYERLWHFKVLVVWESILVVSLVSEWAGNINTFHGAFYAVMWFIVFCTMWWAYFPMAEEKIQKQEIQNLNTFLLSHLTMFIGIIIFAVGIKWALETESDNIASHFNTYLTAGITIYIFANTLLRIMHKIKKRKLLSMIWWGIIMLIIGSLALSYLISINSYLLASTIILSFIAYSLILNRKLFCH